MVSLTTDQCRNLKLIGAYAFFAAIAIGVNLGAQYLTITAMNAIPLGTTIIQVPFLFAGPWNMLIGMLVGTITGLLVKYILDKKYIFAYEPKDLKDDSTAFFLYSVMGLVTTAIFYGTQLLFFKVFGTQTMFYVGGALGLGMGYWVKYELDKRFVFKK